MPFLDALGGQRPQRGQVLGQADRDHHLGQFPSGPHVQDLEGDAGRGVGPGGSADGSDRHRHLQPTDQVALLVPAPGGKAGVLARAGGVGVRACLNGPPVLPGGDGDCVHSVEDPLVVGRRPVGIDGGEGPGLDDPLHHPLAGEVVEGQRVGRNGALGAGQPSLGQVGEDAQPDPPAGDFLDEGGQGLAGGVDRVGPHRVPAVVDQMDHQHRPGGGLRQRAHLQVARAAPQPPDDRVHLVGAGQDPLLGRHHRRPRCLQIVQVQHLDLADHLRGGRFGAEPPASAGQFGGEGGPGDHRRLLDRHRHQDVPTVDPEVERDPQR